MAGTGKGPVGSGPEWEGGHKGSRRMRRLGPGIAWEPLSFPSSGGCTRTGGRGGGARVSAHMPHEAHLRVGARARASALYPCRHPLISVQHNFPPSAHPPRAHCPCQVCYMPAQADTFVVTFNRWLQRFGGGGPFGAADAGFVEALGPRLSREALLDRYSQHTANCATCQAGLKQVGGRGLRAQGSWALGMVCSRAPHNNGTAAVWAAGTGFDTVANQRLQALVAQWAAAGGVGWAWAGKL